MFLFKRRTQPAAVVFTASETTSDEARNAITSAVANRPVVEGMILPHLSTLVEILTERNTTQRDAEEAADSFFRFSWGAIPAGSSAMHFAEQVYETLGRSHEIPRSWKN